VRADRLISALLVLQSRGRVTAAELADELDVSIPTARRDLEALSSAGIPVYPQSGRGGGWQLVGGARTDLSGLSASEAQALFLLVGPAAAASDEVKTALRKLVRALPQTFREQAEAAATATIVDPAAWSAVGRSRPALVDELQDAVIRRRKVTLSYRGVRGAGERVVDPWGLVEKADLWYLVAGTEHGQRTFRLDRIVEAAITDLPAHRPDDFDLDAAWRDVVGTVEQKRSRTWASVKIAARYVPILRDQFGVHCRVQQNLADGLCLVALAAPTALDIARNLAGWGAMVEVVEPDTVREQLARIGAELATQYA
jgi:predicted DNA-binding transcriptional regulator YafY